MPPSRLGGAAINSALTLTPNELMHGGTRPVLPCTSTSVAYLIEGCSARFAPLDEEGRLIALCELMSLAHQPGEPIDALVSRYELGRRRPREEGGGGDRSNTSS